MSHRVATPDDGAGLAAIYAPIVRDTVISFESRPPDAAEMGRRVAATLPTHPWLVWEEGGAVLGYAYAGPHRVRPAYAWAVEVSAYVHASVRRRGIARQLYAAVLEILDQQGYRRVLAGITLPNEASVGLHERLGFAPVGVYRAVGFKAGRWHDVGWWQRSLGEGDSTVPGVPPTRFDTL